MSGDDPERVRNTLESMIAYCERIAYHMHRFGGRNEFLKDWSYQDACVMILGQIGESAKTIEPWLVSHHGYNWSRVIRFRDFAYHNYSKTKYEMVWKMISEDVPELLDILKELLPVAESEIGPTANR
jgi:uncharacterized protein with HEPN domain